jgi:hypothetical protein
MKLKFVATKASIIFSWLAIAILIWAFFENASVLAITAVFVLLIGLANMELNINSTGEKIIINANLNNVIVHNDSENETEGI